MENLHVPERGPIKLKDRGAVELNKTFIFFVPDGLNEIA